MRAAIDLDFIWRRCSALDERIIAAKAGTAHLRCSM